MRNFGRALEKHGVEYLLISGQAAVLYGASDFSEDVDLWVNPTVANWRRLKTALREAGARYYKLTPPMTPRHILGGHGFHFVLPEIGAFPPYVDIMGRPPRVGSFAECIARSRTHETSWGTLQVVHVEDLVRLKLTRRLADYDVINRLVEGSMTHLMGEGEASQIRFVLQWTFDSHRLEQMACSPEACKMARRMRRPVLRLFDRLDPLHRGPPRGFRDRAQDELLKEIGRHQRADLRYWSRIIAELKRLRGEGRLMREGERV